MTIKITKTQSPEPPVYRLHWLGQAGFDIRVADKRIIIDPYLSDSLAKKYAGKEFAHQRMMESPLNPEEIRDVDYLLCTHRHSDHIDPETAPVILKNNPKCIMVAPQAERDHILGLGIAEEQIFFTNAGDKIKIAEGFTIDVIPSAHEELKKDSSGNMHFLGYILSYNGVKMYHSGDCVPYGEQSKLLSDAKVDIALLPINGRDEFRTSRGVPGNMTFDEAVELCKETGIKHLICHHFGMFSFNTADMDYVQAGILQLNRKELEVIIPEIDKELNIYSK